MKDQLVNEKIHAYTVNQRKLILNEIVTETETGKLWVEKLRRYVSLHGRNIHKKAKLSFLTETESHLRWVLNCLHCGLRSDPKDQALINAALHLERYANPSQKKEIEEKCIQLEEWLLTTQPIKLPIHCVIPSFKGIRIANLEKARKKGVVIISPSPFSMYTLTVYNILKALNISVEAVVLRRFTVARFKDEFSRDGLKLLRKIWRKLILKSNENSDKSEVSQKYNLERFGSEANDIRKLAYLDGVKCIEVDNLIDQDDEITLLNADIAIFTGGGMLSDKFLKQFRFGVINTHMGSLPRFKGMDVVEAPILEGNFDDITLTSHFMVRALDAGPVLQEYKISSLNYSTLGSLRNELASVMPIIAVDSCIGYLTGTLKEIEQPPTGRQYYFIHQRLRKVIENTISKRFVKSGSSSPKEMCEDLFGKLESLT